MQQGIKAFRMPKAKASPHFWKFCVSIVVLSFMTLQITSCAPLKLPPYKADAFNSYGNQVTQNDLHIAIQPMMDKEQQAKYFEVVLTDAGVLPIFIIAENRSASQSFLLRDDRISLQNKTTKQAFPKPFQTDVADDSHLHGARTVAGVAGPVLLSLPIIFVSLGLAVNSEKVKAIQDSLFDKTLYTQTVLPGKTAEGFAFFKISDSKMDLSDPKESLQDLLLGIQVIDEGAQTTHDFEFGLP